MESKENYAQVKEESNLFLYAWKFKSKEEHFMIWASKNPINQEFLENKYKEFTNTQCKTIEFSTINGRYTGLKGLIYYV